MKKLFKPGIAVILAAMALGTASVPVQAQEEVPVFITLGQSNADGSAFFDPAEDSRLNAWYVSDENPGKMKIWYRSTQVQNIASNSLGEAARWVIDGTTTDVEPGWLNLWYRNENTSGRTSMNMIHGFGTYSTGTDTNCAQGRRGMEGEFGMKFQQAYPQSELYVLKLGVSGSFISSWANAADNHNWDYFYENIFKPAINDLLARGKRPRLAGIWWMQGCADHAQTKAYYEKCLKEFIEKCRNDLGFADGKIYVGHILKPGESASYPAGSAQYGQGVRDAQDAVASATDGVEILDTRNFTMQYESAFSGYLHFDHAGVNAIGDALAEKVIADGPDNWSLFSTPGEWTETGGSATFTPAVGNPDISYTTEGNTITASLRYDGWSETKTYTLGGGTTEEAPYTNLVWSKGDYDSRYYRIPGIETAADGSVIAVIDARHTSLEDLPNYISVYARRSEDKGRTWSDNIVIKQGSNQSDKKGGYGDPAIVRNLSNDKIHIFYNGNNGYLQSTYSDPITLWMSTSDDNGKTWGEPVDITRRIYQSDWNGAFITSGRGYSTEDGRIYLALNVRQSDKSGSYSWACWTDDDGATWHVADNSATPLGNGNESKIVGLTDGTLLMSIRAQGQHMFSKSTDGGVTWGSPYVASDIIEPGCNGDIIRYPSADGRDRLMLSVPNNSSRRTNNTIFISYDEGQTWPVKKSIHGDDSAYSSMAVFPDGTIAYLVEDGYYWGGLGNGFNIRYYNFPLSYLEGESDPSDALLSPGYLDCDGTRYMTIPNTDGIFDVDVDGQMSLYFRCHINKWGNGIGLVCHRTHPSASNTSLLDGFEFYHHESAGRAASLNVNQNSGSSQQNLNGTAFYDLAAVGMADYDLSDTDSYIEFAWVYDPANHRSDAYINGIKVEGMRPALATAMMYKLTSTKDILVGARYMGNNDAIANMLDGRIDDVRFYSRALTDAEVAGQSSVTVDENTPDLIAAYDFNKIIGSTVPDISGNGNDGKLVGFPDYVPETDRFTVTYTVPDPNKGTLEIYSGDKSLYSGALVDGGTEIRIVATPATGFLTSGILVNGEPIEGTVHVVEESCNVSVVFDRDPNIDIVYNIPSGTMHSNGQTYVESVATRGASKNIDVTFSACPSDLYTLLDQTIEVLPGTPFTLNIDAHKLGDYSTSTVYQDLRYTCAYIYTDWYGLGTWNSHKVLGSVPPSNNILGNYNEVMAISELMTPPADTAAGTKARIRVIYSNAWSAINSADASNVSEGQAIDIPVLYTSTSSIDEIVSGEESGPVEYYNLQGIRISSSDLLPGIYLRRQGGRTDKILIK